MLELLTVTGALTDFVIAPCVTVADKVPLPLTAPPEYVTACPLEGTEPIVVVQVYVRPGIELLYWSTAWAVTEALLLTCNVIAFGETLTDESALAATANVLLTPVTAPPIPVTEILLVAMAFVKTKVLDQVPPASVAVCGATVFVSSATTTDPLTLFINTPLDERAEMVIDVGAPAVIDAGMADIS